MNDIGQSNSSELKSKNSFIIKRNQNKTDIKRFRYEPSRKKEENKMLSSLSLFNMKEEILPKQNIINKANINEVFCSKNNKNLNIINNNIKIFSYTDKLYFHNNEINHKKILTKNSSHDKLLIVKKKNPCENMSQNFDKKSSKSKLDETKNTYIKSSFYTGAKKQNSQKFFKVKIKNDIKDKNIGMSSKSNKKNKKHKLYFNNLIQKSKYPPKVNFYDNIIKQFYEKTNIGNNNMQTIISVKNPEKFKKELLFSPIKKRRRKMSFKSEKEIIKEESKQIDIEQKESKSPIIQEQNTNNNINNNNVKEEKNNRQKTDDNNNKDKNIIQKSKGSNKFFKNIKLNPLRIFCCLNCSE